MTTAVLDACVLYPTVLRQVLLGAAGQGLFAPVWSARILEEWARAAARGGPVAETVARGEIAALRAAWPDAERAATAVPTVTLPDPADEHVLASALSAGVSRIVTANLRDFPTRRLAPLGVRAVHPDPFLLALHDEAPETVAEIVAEVAAAAEAALGGALPRRALLKRAGLPRLGKRLG